MWQGKRRKVTQTAKKRVVLLGASNLMRGISTVVETAEIAWGTPLDVMTACGHGRSYGTTSRVLGRSLPAIVSCGLWDDLATRIPLPTAALITDVGNDILYGADAKQIVSWVEQLLGRLAPVCDKIVVTGLPLASIRRLSRASFWVFRTLLFPGSQLTLDAGMRRADKTDALLRAAATKFGASFIAPRVEWYGLDPIHMRLRDWSRAWGEILAAWCDESLRNQASGSLLRCFKLRAQRPLYRTLFGIEQRRAQPTCKLRNETTVSLY
jgi:hypothetical protein